MDQKPWEEYATTPQQPQAGPWTEYAQSQQATEEPPSVGGVAKAFVKQGIGMATGALKGAAHTAEGAANIATLGIPHMVERALPRGKEAQAQRAKMETPEGTSEKVGYGVEQAAEFFLPTPASKIQAPANASRMVRTMFGAAREAAQGAIIGSAQGGAKEGAQAAAIGGVAGGAAGAVSGAIPLMKPILNPAEKTALAAMEKAGVPLSVGQRTGRVGLQKLERGLENFPGSGARAEEFFKGQQEQLSKVGKSLAKNVSPTETNHYGAGKAVQDRLTQRVQRLKSYANDLYDQVRTETAANTKTVQSGTKTSPIVGPSGQPITTPVYKTLETPVDLAPIRRSLQPIYEDLERSLPEARRANSPAFRALTDVMKSDEKFMNAMDFDKFMSAVKALARDGKSELLSSKSQGLAKQVIKAGEAEFQKAVQGAGPDTLSKLTKARNAVKSYYATDDLLNSLRDEPAALYKNLVSGGDVTHNTLKELQAVAPAEVRVIGRTALEGILQKGTAEGGLGRAAGMMADWQRIGPETKNLLYGSALTKDLDNYFLATKRLVPAEGSATAGRVASYLPIGIAAGISVDVLRALLTGSFTEAGMAAAGGVATEYLVPNIAARVLFSPKGAQLATKAINGPSQSTARALWAATATAAKDIEAENAQTKEPPK